MPRTDVEAAQTTRASACLQLPVDKQLPLTSLPDDRDAVQSTRYQGLLTSQNERSAPKIESANSTGTSHKRTDDDAGRSSPVHDVAVPQAERQSVGSALGSLRAQENQIPVGRVGNDVQLECEVAAEDLVGRKGD